MKYLLSKKHYSYSTYEKQCLPTPPPDSRDTLIWITPNVFKKYWNPPLLWFIKNLNSPYKKGNLHYVDMFC